MKFKFKLLATAAALALSSVTAFASGIDVSTNPSLLFVAYDGSGATTQTYYRILGSLSSINGTSNTSFSAPTGSIFSTQLAGVATSDIRWNVFALDNVNPVMYITGQSVPALNASGIGAFDVVSQASVLTNSLGGLTQLDVAANGYAKANGEYAPSTNGGDQTNAYTLVPNFEFSSFGGGKVGGSQNFDSVSGVDGTISQLYTNSALSAFNGDAKGGYFTLTDALGDVTWTAAAVSAVPLPAAGLLFAPGLLGMLGLGRRRNKQA